MKLHEKHGMTLEEWKTISFQYGCRSGNFKGRKTREEEEKIKKLRKENGVLKKKTGKFLISFE